MRVKSLLNFIEDIFKMSEKFTINFKSVLIYFVNDFETSKKPGGTTDVFACFLIICL